MGQYFTFINIDKRQQFASGGKFGEIFLEDTPCDIIKLLAVPEVQSFKRDTDKTNSNDHNTMFYGTRTAEEEDSEPGCWAGDRIICIGDYVGDWPDNILSADNGDSLEQPMFLYNYAVNPIPHRYYYGRFVESPDYSGTGVLRNLTKKIYVRSKGIPTFDTTGRLCFFNDSPVDSHPGLGHVLMSRIGWSSDPSAAMAWDEADTLTQGEWAGDRFDVRSYKDVKKELESGGWTDVTEQEAERFIRIWKAEGYEMRSRRWWPFEETTSVSYSCS